jgi:small subunit ribosomal protein S22
VNAFLKKILYSENVSGYDASKYVFTDITFGVHDRKRLIVVREPDGTLRDAEGDERDRLNQVPGTLGGRGQ